MHTLTVAALAALAFTTPLSEEEAHRWSNASAGLEEAPAPVRRLVLLRAARRLEAGEPATALAMLVPHAHGEDPLAEAIRFHAARLELALGGEARPGLEKLFEGEPGPDARWGISRQEEAEALLLLAGRFEQAGRGQEAARLRTRVVLEYPRWAPAPAGMSRAERRARAANLIRDMDYAGGLATLEALLADAPAQERRPLQRELGRFIGDKLRDDYGRVAAIFTELAAAPDATPDDLLYLAYAKGKLDPRGSISVYQQIPARFPAHPSREQAAFFIAWTELDLERFDAAEAGFDRFLREQPASAYTAAARWYRGLALYRQSKLEPALEDFRFSAREGNERDKGRYWTARALQQLGREAEAVELLQRLARREPFSYYGMLARARLPEARRPEVFVAAARLPAAALPDAEAEQLLGRLPATTQALVTEALAAAQMGEPDLAAALLQHVEPELGYARKHTRLLTWARRRLGAVHRLLRGPEAQSCRGALSADPASPAVRDCWLVLYPTPYAREIEAVRGAVPAALFWALMRQESGFLPTARSHADALGLMQVIPQVGSAAAEALGMRFAPYELVRPAVNLKLFAHAARERFELFGGHLPLVAMSYNASPEAVQAWLRDNHDLPFDLFVEEIPYKETRDYLKHTAAHLARYATLLGETGAPLWERAALPHPDTPVSTAFAEVVRGLEIETVVQAAE